MSIEKNLDLIHRMYDALNAQDLDAQDEFWAEDMIWHGPPGFGDIHGIEGFKYEVLQPFYAAFPDYHVKNDIEVADENWIFIDLLYFLKQQGLDVLERNRGFI